MGDVWRSHALGAVGRVGAFYASLKARGKASKVALIAFARKLLALANALLRTNTPYQPRTNSVCPKTA